VVEKLEGLGAVLIDEAEALTAPFERLAHIEIGADFDGDVFVLVWHQALSPHRNHSRRL
jgi:hypothetical protein